MMAPQYLLVDAESGEAIIQHLQLATTFWQRFRGLQFRSELAKSHGLLIYKCKSIHTHWMRFSIDVAMLDEQGTVLAVHSKLRPWRMLAGPAGTHSILEAPADTLHLRVGQQMTIRSPDNSHFPPPVQFVNRSSISKN